MSGWIDRADYPKERPVAPKTATTPSGPRWIDQAEYPQDKVTPSTPPTTPGVYSRWIDKAEYPQT